MVILRKVTKVLDCYGVPILHVIRLNKICSLYIYSCFIANKYMRNVPSFKTRRNQHHEHR